MCSKRTLDEAKKNLGLVTHRKGKGKDHVVWSALPTATEPKKQPAKAGSVAKKSANKPAQARAAGEKASGQKGYRHGDREQAAGQQGTDQSADGPIAQNVGDRNLVRTVNSLQIAVCKELQHKSRKVAIGTRPAIKHYTEKENTMSEQTNISWTDHTFNPWMGCDKVSAGCNNCYAEQLVGGRWATPAIVPWGTAKYATPSAYAVNWAKVPEVEHLGLEAFMAKLSLCPVHRARPCHSFSFRQTA